MYTQRNRHKRIWWTKNSSQLLRHRSLEKKIEIPNYFKLDMLLAPLLFPLQWTTNKASHESLLIPALAYSDIFVNLSSITSMIRQSMLFVLIIDEKRKHKRMTAKLKVILSDALLLLFWKIILRISFFLWFKTNDQVSSKGRGDFSSLRP